MSKYTLIIAEKPDAAYRLASALDEKGKAKRNVENGVPYYEAYREKRIVVVPAMGHLYTVSAGRKQSQTYPIFNYEWVPRYKVEPGAKRTRIWLQTINSLSKGADLFIDACDYDIEGSIIGYSILKYACGGKEKEAKRMKYSTLTEDELKTAYATLLPHLDFSLIDAGLVRHEIDWLYGINLSRALTTAAKNFSKKYTILSTGRVQGPTLKFLAARERNIACFVPIPFWRVKVKAKIGGQVFEAEYEKLAIDFKEEAEAVAAACRGKTGEVEKVETKRVQQAPPLPFDLGSLQSEAYRLFRYTPMRTSSVAQQLYLDALISYPRTNSQKLPTNIGYVKILTNLAKNPEYTHLAGKLLAKSLLKPTEGRRQDLAHPAIYPTGKTPHRDLAGAEKNIYDLVVRRFLAVFGDPATRQTIKVILNINSKRFFLSGQQTLDKGWLCFYEGFVQVKDRSLPSIAEGESVRVQRVALENKFTKPPMRYNPGSLLKKMEQANIGTKATRASTMQTLHDREYVRGERIVVTELGLAVADVLRRFCPNVVSVEFTRQLEEKMSWVQQGKETKQKIVQDAIGSLKPLLANLKTNEEAVGKQLSNAVSQAKLEKVTIGPCPVCHTGKLIIQHSKKTKKRFVGCTNYFEGICGAAFPLPQKGNVKPSSKTCGTCGWSTVLVSFKGRHPWNLCFNLECPSKKASEGKV